MPTIRAEFPVTLKTNIEISRDFDLNVYYQLAVALYKRILEMDEDAAVDFLIEAIVDPGEGKPVNSNLT